MNKIIFIVGPTATGKSELAYKLARKIGAQIISCDSMLVYREPKIITSKPPSYMLESITHHFIDIISIQESYDVFTYYTQATSIIRGLVSGNTPVIVCGGTGLYAKALLDGIFSGASRDQTLREELKKEAQIRGKDYLYNKLEKVDPKAAKKISPNDLKRIIRALEVYYLTGIPISEKQKEAQGLWRRYPIRIFGLSLTRDLLYHRISERVDKMFADGAVEEVKNLLKLDLSLTGAKIIGIKEIALLLEGQITLDQAKELMKKNTRNFAKRQLTWFRKDKRIEWIDAGKDANNLSERIIRRCTRLQR
jgi:tRNA dimethylallyltransferase